MRIRTAKFAMIPMWVIQHPEVRGNGTRIAVYAGIQAVAWESPDTEWRSTREMAVAVAEVTGIGEEACRKHLSALVTLGAIIKTNEVILPADPPRLGMPVGTTEPTNGAGGTQSDDRTTTAEKGSNRKHGVGTHASSPDGDGRCFDEFWNLYPRRTGVGGPRGARKAFEKAVKTTPWATIRPALEQRVAWWKRSSTPMDKIPHPATWLNQTRWLDEVEPLAASVAASVVQARADVEARQFDEVQRAVADGDTALAWRLVRSRAKANGDRWFDEIAGMLEDGRNGEVIRQVVKRDGQPVTDRDILQVTDARRALSPPLSLGAADSSS